MTRYTDHHTLTPARLANLRLIVNRTTRVHDKPVILARNQLKWFADHGYIEPMPVLPPTDGPLASRPWPVATAKGREAVAAADGEVRT